MDNGVLLVILILAVLVVGVNGALFLLLKRGRTDQYFTLWKKVANQARNPWQQEEDNLDELSRLVSDLKQIEKAEQDS
jgi:hypothetical protein